MCALSADSIMQKLHAWAGTPEGQRRMKDKVVQYRREGKKETCAGAKLVDEKEMVFAALDFISILKSVANSYASSGGDGGIPPSVLAHFNSLSYDAPQNIGDGIFQVRINFATDLSRPSLENDLGYEGIDNIIAVFNNGTNASASVYGWWNGHSPKGESLYRSGYGSESAWIKSKPHREGLHFIQEAVRQFESSAKNKYNYSVSVFPGDIYQ